MPLVAAKPIVSRAPPPRPQLTVLDYAIAAWPMWLIAIGGLVGATCGLAGWYVNTLILKTSRPLAQKYGLVVLSGVCAALAYFAVAGIIA